MNGVHGANMTLRKNVPVSSCAASASQRGFSLLEALVAMAIASIAFAALYSTVGQGSKAAVDVNARAEAALVARSVLASAVFADDFQKLPAGQSGTWNWSVQVAPERVMVSDADGRTPPRPVMGAQVLINVRAARSDTPVVSWTVWKPLRSAS